MVFDQERRFCCQGCFTVAHTIVDQGLDDYYRFRDAKARKGERDVVPDVLRKLKLYDNEEVQRSFVQFTGKTREASLILDDIRCAACLWLNEQHLRGLDGVIGVDLDYTSQRARVEWDPDKIKLSEILESIANIGYVAYPYDASHRQKLLEDQKRRSSDRLIFAGLVGMMVMQFALATYIFPSAFVGKGGDMETWEWFGRWTSMFATITLLVYPAQDFFVGAWRDLRARRLGMDVPIVLGISMAFVGSVVATVKGSGEVYFDSIAMFIFLLLVARFVEMKGRISAADALDRLAKVVPDTARRVDAEGAEQIVAVFELQPGDLVRVMPGENVPVDGVLREGASAFDESLLTGESLPVSKQPGDELIGGAGNQEQPILMEVMRLSEQSTATEIRHLLEKGMKAKPSYAVLADRASGWFVSIVLIVAAITALSWYLIDPASALENTIAVLIVTCPCALALATPVAITIGAGRFAKHGVLPLKMSAIEGFAQGEIIAFDKTGTLTLGVPTLQETRALGRLSEAEGLAICAALEAVSEHHPVARAMRAAADAELPELVDIRHVPGKGVEGRLDGVLWRFGSPEYVIDDPDVDQQAMIEQSRVDGGLIVALGYPGHLEMIFVLNDQLRPGALALVDGLKKTGIHRVVILSGDHPVNVNHVADLLGVDEVHGGISSAEKLAWIEAKQQEGHKVIMVGDGINDAPTLAAANVSLSFSEATQMAQAHSDYLLLGEDLNALVAARSLAIKTRRIIFQNLGWAASYNLLAIPAAALGFIPPWGAAIGMSASSLFVVLNALRLKKL